MKLYSCTKVLAKAVGVLAVLVPTHFASAETFKIELKSNVVPLNPATWLDMPQQFNNGPVDLKAIFFVDDQSAVEFGNFACGAGSATHCGAYGYGISNLQVFINGVQQEGWLAGVNAKSFDNGPIDLKQRSFFLAGGLFEITNAWLPLINQAFPEAAFNFGQMYRSIGGVGFASFGFSAVDRLNQRANGWVAASSTLMTAVPEPSSYLLALFAMFPILVRKVTSKWHRL